MSCNCLQVWRIFITECEADLQVHYRLNFAYINHCKLATLSRRQKPTLPGRRYCSMSPAGRQSLQFYNECIKWWPSANNFQCCPRAFGPRATLEIIGFSSPLDKASIRGGVFSCTRFVLSLSLCLKSSGYKSLRISSTYVAQPELD